MAGIPNNGVVPSFEHADRRRDVNDDVNDDDRKERQRETREEGG